MPRRSDINPMKIPSLLPNIFIGEYISEKLLKIRLSGTALDEVAGFSMTGGNYFDICPSVERPFFTAICKAVVQQPCGMRMTRSITLKNGRVHQYRSVSLPLADSEGVPRYILGMANVALDITYRGYEKSQQMSSEIDDFSYLDIGAGTPPLPARLQD